MFDAVLMQRSWLTGERCDYCGGTIRSELDEFSERERKCVLCSRVPADPYQVPLPFIRDREDHYNARRRRTKHG